MYLICFRKVLLVSSLKWKGLASMRTANWEKPLYTTSAVSHQVYVHALLVQHLLHVFFQHMVWYAPTSESVWMQRRQKNWLKYTDFTELKKVTIRIYSKCLIYSSLLPMSFKFYCCSFCLIKKGIYS